jgi:hypothetical protein
MRGTLQARRRDVEAEPASKSDRILHLTSPATLQSCGDRVLLRQW